MVKELIILTIIKVSKLVDNENHQLEYDLPNKDWPKSGLTPINPTNQTHGPKPITIEHRESQSLSDAIIESLGHFPSPKKILIIIIRPFPNIPSELIKAVKNARGHQPIVIVDKSSEKITDCISDHSFRFTKVEQAHN